MAKRVPRGFVVAAQEIDIENVLPGSSAHGAGLDLAQADVAQREDTERFEQSAGQILDLEGDGRFVCAARNEALVAGRESRTSIPARATHFPCQLADQEEAGE